jgi:hypothetical protein
MQRLLICVPLCLLLGHSLPDKTPSADQVSPPRPAQKDDAPLPAPAEMENLAGKAPVAFLKACIRYYDSKVEGYTAVMRKRERIDGRLQDQEVLNIAFREKPFSVYLEWTEGARLADRSLYVEGQNRGKALARPHGFFARKVAGDVVPRDPEGPDAKKSGRYPITQYGIRKGMERALASWEAAQKKDELHIELLGDVKVAEAGGRVCLGLKRVKYARPENDGVMGLTLYIDKETWLQVGSVLVDANGELIGAYYFRDLQLNPKFKDKQFTEAALKP